MNQLGMAIGRLPSKNIKFLQQKALRKFPVRPPKQRALRCVWLAK